MNARDIVVFLGPSLSIDEAQRTLPARYFGPARCGDVLRARRLSPRVIAIVDGLFAGTAAIWHKEILLALEDGIAVFGASSMGALRAAELVPFGMVGIGRIFEAYRDGVYTDDDEVALLHGPEESRYRQMSEAMVNIRATVAHAVSAGVVSRVSADRVLRCAKDTFYQARSIGAAIEGAWAHDPRAEEPNRLRDFIASGGSVNQKRLDALELLAHLRDRRTTPPAVASPVHRTSFILRLHHETMCQPFDAADTDIPPDERVAVAAALGRIYPLLRRLAQLMALVHGLAGGVPATGTRQAAARAGFEDRLARIRSVVEDYARRRGTRTVRRVRQRHILDMMRLDDRYRGLRPARGSKGACAVHVLRKARRTAGADARLYRSTAALWAIVDEQLERACVEPPVPMQFLSDEFRRKRGLESRTATLAWWRANDLDRHGFERLVAMDARLALVSAGAQAHVLGLRLMTDPVCWLVDAIRLAGLYSCLEKRVGRTEAATDGPPVGRAGMQE